MKYVKVKDLGQIVTGNTPSTSDMSNYGDFMPFIKATDIILGSRYTYITEQRYSEKSYKKYKENVIPKGSTCIVTIGSIGKKMTQAHTDLFVNQAINAILPYEQYDKDYIYYATKYAVLPQLKIYDSGTTSGRENISKSSFSNIRLYVEEDFSTQQKIASILSAYDRLIENNTRRIRLLEQMAENLYKEWFVRFRFPGHENVEIVNGLPKGWERTKLIKNIKTSSGGTPSRNKSEYYKNGDIPWMIKTGELQDCILINTEECITEDAVNNSSAKIFPKGTLLMAMYGVNVGKLGISEIKATCNQACCVFTPKHIDYKYYLFHYFKSIREYLLSISFGAAQQNLSQELIKSIKVLFPDEKTNISFVKEVEPLFREISIIQQQNQLLTRQRDLLLPRLMSGKLEVKS